MDRVRVQRVESLLQQLISKMIADSSIKDYRVSFELSVSRVELARDASFARIYISSFASKERAIAGVKGLNNAAKFIKRALAPKLKLRNIPNFSFVLDSSLEDAFNINQKLENLLSATADSEPRLSKDIDLNE